MPVASARACLSGLPVSRASICAISSWHAATSIESRARMRPRSAALVAPQTPSYAARAALTARSMSALVPRASSANTCPSDGSTTGIVSPPDAAIHRLPMKCFASSMRVSLSVRSLTVPESIATHPGRGAPLAIMPQCLTSQRPRSIRDAPERAASISRFPNSTSPESAHELQ
ncbi:conserved hypothetical protein [Burkholderia sp. 8Y]|nr:conserved hypothetical protein [Burkholderia sp. 8Y]